MDDLGPFHESKRTRTFFECNEIHVLKQSMNLPEIKSTENVWNIMKKEIGNQLSCLKEDMLRRVCKAWYSVRPSVLEVHNNSIPIRNEDLIKAKGVAKYTDFICSMHTGMLLCLLLKVFKPAIVFLLERN